MKKVLVILTHVPQVFDLLWRLVSHDIWFVWERAEYLQHTDPAMLVQAQFRVYFNTFYFRILFFAAMLNSHSHVNNELLF